MQKVCARERLQPFALAAHVISPSRHLVCHVVLTLLRENSINGTKNTENNALCPRDGEQWAIWCMDTIKCWHFIIALMLIAYYELRFSRISCILRADPFSFTGRSTSCAHCVVHIYLCFGVKCKGLGTYSDVF